MGLNLYHLYPLLGEVAAVRWDHGLLRDVWRSVQGRAELRRVHLQYNQTTYAPLPGQTRHRDHHLGQDQGEYNPTTHAPLQGTETIISDKTKVSTTKQPMRRYPVKLGTETIISDKTKVSTTKQPMRRYPVKPGTETIISDKTKVSEPSPKRWHKTSQRLSQVSWIDFAFFTARHVKTWS